MKYLRKDREVYRRIPVKALNTKVEPHQPYVVEVKVKELILIYIDIDNKLHDIEKIAKKSILIFR